MVIMSFCLYILFIINLNFNYVYTIETDFHLYLDNQTLCNQGIIDLNDIHTWKIYSHTSYRDQFLYFPDNHCAVTIKTKKRIWMSVKAFQSNSSTSFPRCSEAKYAGIDDRLQIIDGYGNGSMLRIICGKDTDKRFDRTPLILKSSIFTIDWQTKSQSFGFELQFVSYDLSTDGKCLNFNQFQCKNNRCIDRSLLCSNEDYCGDNSQQERNKQCPMKVAKQKLINWLWMLILLIVCCCCFVLFLFIFIRRKNKECRGGL